MREELDTWKENELMVSLRFLVSCPVEGYTEHSLLFLGRWGHFFPAMQYWSAVFISFILAASISLLVYFLQILQKQNGFKDVLFYKALGTGFQSIWLVQKIIHQTFQIVFLITSYMG